MYRTLRTSEKLILVLPKKQLGLLSKQGQINDNALYDFDDQEQRNELNNAPMAYYCYAQLALFN